MSDDGAGASPVERGVRPLCYMAKEVAAKLQSQVPEIAPNYGATTTVTIAMVFKDDAALYGQDALDAAVAAERERWAPIVADLRHMAEKYEMPDGDYCSVTVGMWAEDWLRRLEGPNNDKPGTLSVTCKTAAAAYKKHFLGLSDNVTYFVEQVNDMPVNTYHYRVFFKPQAILPNIDFKGSLTGN